MLSTNNLKEGEASKLDKFPIDVYPGEIQNIIKELDRVYGYSNDLISASMLFTMSVAIGNSHYIKIKDGWSDSSALYIVLIATAGGGKTHALKWCNEPLMLHDATMKKHYDDELQAFKRNDEQGDKPKAKQILLQDFTMESLIFIHQQNERGLGVYVDELGSWFKKFDQYRGGSDKENWLSIWSNQMVKVNRKTNSEYISIQKPFISVIGNIQPKELESLIEGNKFNGFSDRLFFVETEDRYTPLNELEFASEHKAKWFDVINTVVRKELNYDTLGNVSPNMIPCSTEAFNTLKDWDNRNLEKYNSTPDEMQLIPKSKTHAIRFSLILEMLTCVVNGKEIETISNQSMLNAIRLAEYYVRQQVRVSDILEQTNVDKLSKDKQMWYHGLNQSFTRANAIDTLCHPPFDVPITEVDKFIQRGVNKTKLFMREKHGSYLKVLG